MVWNKVLCTTTSLIVCSPLFPSLYSISCWFPFVFVLPPFWEEEEEKTRANSAKKNLLNTCSKLSLITVLYAAITLTNKNKKSWLLDLNFKCAWYNKWSTSNLCSITRTSHEKTLLAFQPLDFPLQMAYFEVINIQYGRFCIIKCLNLFRVIEYRAYNALFHLFRLKFVQNDWISSLQCFISFI